MGQVDPNCDYQTWTNIGFALHNYYEEVDYELGLQLYDQWSSGGDDYPGTHAISVKWRSFRGNYADRKITIGTLFHYAQNSEYDVDRFKSDIEVGNLSQFQQFLIRQYNQLNSQFKRGFKSQTLTIPDLAPVNFTYHPDRPLPNPDDYKHQGIPQIIIPQKYFLHRGQIIEKLVILGWHHLFENSQTGSGKSYSIAGLNNVVYLDNNYQNVSSQNLQQFPAMAPRTRYGIYQVNNRYQVDPPREQRKKDNQIISGNCHLKNIFTGLESKGYSPTENNSPCLQCQHVAYCGSSEYLFKGRRRGRAGRR